MPVHTNVDCTFVLHLRVWILLLFPIYTPRGSYASQQNQNELSILPCKKSNILWNEREVFCYEIRCMCDSGYFPRESGGGEGEGGRYHLPTHVLKGTGRVRRVGRGVWRTVAFMYPCFDFVCIYDYEQKTCIFEWRCSITGFLITSAGSVIQNVHYMDYTIVFCFYRKAWFVRTVDSRQMAKLADCMKGTTDGY